MRISAAFNRTQEKIINDDCVLKTRQESFGGFRKKLIALYKPAKQIKIILCAMTSNPRRAESK